MNDLVVTVRRRRGKGRRGRAARLRKQALSELQQQRPRVRAAR